MYNQHETVYYKSSVDLEEFIKPHLEKLKEGGEELGLDGIVNAEKVTRKTKQIEKKRVEKKK